MKATPTLAQKLLIFSAFFLLLLTISAQAQKPANPDSALLGILADLKGTPLTLQQATEYALKNATAVRRAEASYLAARGSVRRDRGLYDPTLFFDLNYVDQELPTATFFAGAPVLMTQQTTSRTGLRLNLPIGTRIELAMNTSNLNTNTQFAFLNPEYTALGSLSLRQPLLGGFAASARKQLTSSEYALEAEKARYDQAVLTVGAEVERLYWDLYVAERDYAVQVLSRERADVFLRETELRQKSGLVGPNQVANARTFLAQQELLLIEMDEQLDRLSDRLASLIGQRPQLIESGARFLAVDQPPSDFAVEPVHVLVERAQQSNLYLQAAKKDVEVVRAHYDAAKWESLPSVDLVGSVIGNGLAGSTQEVIFGSDTLRIPPGRDGDLLDAINQAAKRDFPSWSVGVEVNIPLGSRSGLGEKDRLRAQVLNMEQNYIEISRLVEEQVRSSYHELSHGNDRLTAAREGVEAAQEQVRIGLIEFNNGRATAFELVRLGEDFAVAQRAYSAALVRTAKAAATLRQLTSDKNSAIKVN